MKEEGFRKSGLDGRAGPCLGSLRSVKAEGFRESGRERGVVSHHGGLSSGVSLYTVERLTRDCPLAVRPRFVKSVLISLSAHLSPKPTS